MTNKRELTHNDPYATLCWGTMEQSVQVGETIRRFLIYIPDGARSATAGIFILGGNGSSVEALLESSGWRELADREKVILFFLEPENGLWHAQEPYGCPNGDVAYIHAVLVKSLERLHYCVHESKYYLFGEDEGGTLAHMAAMNPPSDETATAIIWAGVTTLRAGEVSEAYRSDCKQDRCTNLMGAWDEEGRLGRLNGSIPMPVWMIESANGSPETLAYWQETNGVCRTPRLLQDGTEEFYRTAEAEYPTNQDKRAYSVWRTVSTSLPDLPAADRAEQIWTRFLSRHRRWMGDPGGELRMTADPVLDLGMEYHMEEIGGWTREWYVYAPESVRKHPDVPVPLVFALHGYSCSGEIYIGNSAWYQVAKDRNFIVVFPTALPGTLGFKSMASDPAAIPLPAWNFLHSLADGPDEFEFFKTLLARVSADFPVDRSRVYITGHSHGSMMTQALALGMPNLFAAAAPCSGVLMAPLYDSFMSLPEIWSNPMPLPVWMFAGKKEEWLIDPQPTMDNATGMTLALWHDRNKLDGDVENCFSSEWAVYRTRWHDLVCTNSAGQPMLRFTTVDDFPHATNPEMSYRIWDEFFAHWSRHGDTCTYA